MDVVWQAVIQLFGENGACKTALSMVEYQEVAGILIIKCSHKALRIVRAAIASVTHIKQERVALHVLAISGTLNALKRKISNERGLNLLRESLRNWMGKWERVVVVGIGNELRKDDFVGVKVVEGLEGQVPENVMLVKSETVPESFLEPILEFNPSHILLIDAGLLGLKPGEVKLAESSDVLSSRTAVSTHALPLRVFCEYLKAALNTSIALILVQPADTSFGEGLSSKIKETAEHLRMIIIQTFNAPKH